MKVLIRMSGIIRRQILGLPNSLEAPKKSRKQRQALAMLRDATDPFSDLSNAEFIKTFRLDKKTVEDLAKELALHMKAEKRSDGLSIMTKILIALGFFATGSHQNVIGQNSILSVSQKSVSRALDEVTEALNKVYKKFVKWPMLPEERNHVKAKFYQKFKFPDVLGCIDGTHVSIVRPPIQEDRFFNRKGYYSLNVMIICDSDLNILCVDPSTPGATRDALVWRAHPLSAHLDDITANGEQLFLLGDSAYPLRRTMMTPIPNTTEWTWDHFYNTKHEIARNTVQRCVAALKARFRCLLSARALHYDPVKAAKIVNACCVLHNLANSAATPIDALTLDETAAELNSQDQYLEEDPNLDGGHMDALRDWRANAALLEGRAVQQAVLNRLCVEREEMMM